MMLRKKCDRYARLNFFRCIFNVVTRVIKLSMFQMRLRIFRKFCDKWLISIWIMLRIDDIYFEASLKSSAYQRIFRASFEKSELNRKNSSKSKSNKRERRCETKSLIETSNSEMLERDLFTTISIILSC